MKSAAAKLDLRAAYDISHLRNRLIVSLSCPACSRRLQYPGGSPRNHPAITRRSLLYISTFGRLSVTDDGRPVAGAASQPRRLAVLAMLCCAGERGLTRDK